MVADEVTHGRIGIQEALHQRLQTLQQDIVLDMGNIEFLDSSGLGVLVTLSKLLPRPYQMAFADMQPLVARVFELTHLDRVYHIQKNPFSHIGDAV